MENKYQNQYQNQYPNQNYAPYPVKNQANVSIGDWIVTFIVMLIPVVNFIMLFVWAFGGSAPESKANWAKANLILYVIGIALVILFWGVIAALIGSLGSLGSLGKW